MIHFVSPPSFLLLQNKRWVFLCVFCVFPDTQPHLVLLSVSTAFVEKTERARVHSRLPQNTCYVTLGPGERSDTIFLSTVAGRTATLFTVSFRCRVPQTQSVLSSPRGHSTCPVQTVFNTDSINLSSCYCCYEKCVCCRPQPEAMQLL